MPWDQIITGAVIVLLGLGGWIYAWRPEPPPRPRRVPPRPRAPRDEGGVVTTSRFQRGPQVPLGR